MQIAVDSLISGLILTVLALGFSVVYISTGIFYITLAAIYVIVPYIAWSCLQKGFSTIPALIIATLCGIIIATISDYINHWPLTKKNSSMAVQMVSSLGLYIVISQATSMIWGNEVKVLRSGLDYTVSCFGSTIPSIRFYSAIISIVLIISIFIWLKYSNMGLKFRGLSDNSTEFALKGHNQIITRMIAFIFAGLFASAASLMNASDIGFSTQVGLVALLPAVVAVIIGGIYSYKGAVVGGILLGSLRTSIGWYASARWVEPVTFILLIIILLWRPNGLFTNRGRVEMNQ